MQCLPFTTVFDELASIAKLTLRSFSTVKPIDCPNTLSFTYFTFSVSILSKSLSLAPLTAYSIDNENPWHICWQICPIV